MTDQEYTMRRDMLRDAIRKTQSELNGQPISFQSEESRK